jgi:thiamine-monophosphate kinase
MPGPNSGDTERVVAGDERGARDDEGEPVPGAAPRPPGGEFAAIERIRALLAHASLSPGPGETWIGDDAAVLEPPQGRMLFTIDVVAAGVHADLRLVAPADVGWKAMVASLSDIAAMGGRPCHAVAAVAGPPGTDLDGLARGMADAAAAFACPVVGGDLSAADQLVVTIAMTGEVEEGSAPVLRSRARPGDVLCVTGPLGASSAGLRALRSGSPSPPALADAHRRPRPRLAEGEAARLAGARAMVDVSDGLADDLGRLAQASGVGFRLEHVPVADGATEEDALGGGEDYELAMAVEDPVRLAQAFEARGLEAPITIGRCVADPGERTWRGRAVTGGWEHHFGT